MERDHLDLGEQRLGLRIRVEVVPDRLQDGVDGLGQSGLNVS